MRRGLAVLGLGAASVVAIAGCGSDSGSAYVPPSGPPVATLEVSAKNFSFTPDKLSAPPGILEIDFTSTEGIHDFVIEGVPGFMLETSAGKTKTGKVELQRGAYTFYCSLPGHRAAGMEGTLTVK
jgi:plastocyanin